MSRHPKKEIHRALEYAASKGWIVLESKKGHCWGIIRCPFGHGGCQKSIWSTPRSPQDHAKDIVRFVDKCVHVAEEREEDEDA